MTEFSAHEFRTEFGSESPGPSLQDGLQFCHIGFKNKGAVIIPIFNRSSLLVCQKLTHKGGGDFP